jgi:hypothetical protein
MILGLHVISVTQLSMGESIDSIATHAITSASVRNASRRTKLISISSPEQRFPKLKSHQQTTKN